MPQIWDMLLPMAALAGLVILLPAALERGKPPSQRHLFRTILTTATAAWLAGAAWLAFAYAAANPALDPNPLAASARSPIFYLERSTLFAMLWGPLLALVWLIRAQEMNRRVGLEMRETAHGSGQDA